MNKLKQNMFWVVCGALGVILLGGFFGFVFPIMSDLGTQRGQIERIGGRLKTTLQEPMLAGTKDIELWRQRQEECKVDYRDLAKHYVERDTELERWFDGPDGRPLVNPRLDQFTTPYEDAKRGLEKRLEDAGMKIGMPDPRDEEKTYYGFNWEQPGRFTLDQVSEKDRAEIVRALQKRFWIAKHVANACAPVQAEGESPRKLVTRLLDMRFLAPLYSEMGRISSAAMDAPAQGVPPPDYLGAWVKPKVGMASRYVEFDLPESIGMTITFGVAVELPCENVPNFLRELINPTGSPQILMNIVGCRVWVPEQHPPEVPDTIPVPTEDKKAAMVEAEIKKRQAELKPVRTHLWLTCQVLDVDPAKLPDWGRPGSGS